MPDVHIVVGQTEALYFYRLTFPNGDQLVVGVTPVTVDVGGRVVGTLTAEYSLVIPLAPLGRPWAFLRGFMPGASYVQQSMQLPPWASSLLASIMPLLARVAPAEDVADAAERWYAGG